MKHGRTSAVGTGAVHALNLAVRVRTSPPSYGALCGVDYTSEEVAPGTFRGRWHYTEEVVSCRRCLARMERLADQALLDERHIAGIADAVAHRPGGGSNPRYADPNVVREFRRDWPAMARAVADLMRHRGVKLGDGWTGPARVFPPRAEAAR